MNCLKKGDDKEEFGVPFIKVTDKYPPELKHYLGLDTKVKRK